MVTGLDFRATGLGSSSPVVAKSFDVTTAGLIVSVSSGFLRQYDDTAWTYAGGTITVPANGTYAIVIDLQTKALHAWTRAIHTGCISVANITFAGGVATSISKPPVVALPATTVPEFKAKIRRNNQKLHIVVIGDSLVETYTATANDWASLMFDPTLSSSGYNLLRPNGTPCLGQVTYENYGMGGSTAFYGAALMGERIKTAYADTAGSTNSAIVYKSYFAAKYLSANGLVKSPILSRNPDLAIVNFGINGGVAWLAIFEQIVRQFRLAGTEVVILTGAKLADGTNNFPETDYFDRIRQVYGCELADTREAIAESVANGGTPYRDNIHPTQAGYNIYAVTVRSILNDLAQAPNDDALPGVQSFVTEDALGSHAFPKAFEVDFDPWTKTGGTGTAGPSGLDTALRNPVLLYGARANATTSYALAVADHAEFGHPHAVGFSLITDTSTSYTASVTIGGVTLPTVSAAAAVKYGTQEGGFFICANFLTNQTTIGQNGWFLTRATVSAGAVTAPDGNATGNKLIEDATATSTHNTQQNLVNASFTDSTQYCFSCYFKAGERTRVGMSWNNKQGAAFPISIFDLSGGVVAIQGSGHVAHIEPATYTYPSAPAGWYRCSINRDAGTGASTPAVNIYIDSGSGLAVSGVTYSGNGTSGLYAWGGKLEFGSSAATTSVPSALHLSTWLNNGSLALVDYASLAHTYRNNRIPWTNASIKVTTTIGTCRLLGICWHTFPNDQLIHTLLTGTLESKDGFSYAGTWLSESWATNVPAVYSDTDLDTVIIPFVGTGIQVLVGAGTAGGKVDVYLDGVAVETAFDLYNAGGNKVFAIDAMSNQANGVYDRGFGKHVLYIKRNGANASAGASGAGNRKLSILSVYQFDTR